MMDMLLPQSVWGEIILVVHVLGVKLVFIASLMSCSMSLSFLVMMLVMLNSI
jgi:hypothetical protein